MGNLVQIKHPMTGLYVRINKDRGKITGHKKTPGPYKGVPIARRRTVKSAPVGPASFTRKKAEEAVKVQRVV